MSLNNAEACFHGFSRLSREERFNRLLELGALTEEDIHYLNQHGIQHIGLAEKLIENALGYFQLPLGVATNFRMDNKDYVIPMAVEETSIIAALSKTARWVRQQGNISAWVHGECILGQIQWSKVQNFAHLESVFNQHKQALIQEVNEHVAFNMVKRGGGVQDMQLRRIARPDGLDMAVIHLSMNSCDAMGANIINQALEYLKTPLEQLSGEQVTMCILSNLNDQKLTTARIIINEIDPSLGEKLQEASLFAETDPYRATTHNKGVMNGMDAVLIATGNDWRAVEAGVHAYAARNGQYQAISTWRYQDGVLTGELTAPVIVGIVGGVTSLHPTARMCLNMMQIESANELSRVITSVGLLQNLGAIRALCTDGIIQGHMKLHIDNLMLVAGAEDHEMPILKTRLQAMLDTHKRINLHNAHALLQEIRLGESAVL